MVDNAPCDLRHCLRASNLQLVRHSHAKQRQLSPEVAARCLDQNRIELLEIRNQNNKKSGYTFQHKVKILFHSNEWVEELIFMPKCFLNQ
ncbi:hypothetical protein M2340_003421 [Sphingobium sp. B2D3D]|nr:hypothetical protein [Sphingobium sp. B2D3D]